MPRAPSGQRYAQAVFQIAVESDSLDQWVEDLNAVEVLLQQSQVSSFLTSPKVNMDEKLRLIKGLLPNVNPLVHNLLGLLTQRGVPLLASQITKEFLRLRDSQQNLERGEVVTAVPLEDNQRAHVVDRLAHALGKTLEVTARVDPAILGGVVARIGDKLIDASTRTRLRQLRSNLIE